MPRRQQIRRRRQSPPLIYCPLSTRSSSYPAWVMLETSSTPIMIKTSDLCSSLALQGFLSSNQVLPVPPMVNDIAEALPWLLEAFPILYRAVAINLFMVCNWQSLHHISPYDAHFRLSMVAINKLLMKSFHGEIFHDASALIQLHLRER